MYFKVLFQGKHFHNLTQFTLYHQTIKKSMIFTKFIKFLHIKILNKNSNKGHNKYRLYDLDIYISKWKKAQKMEKNKELKNNKQNKQNNEQNNHNNNQNNNQKNNENR